MHPHRARSLFLLAAFSAVAALAQAPATARKITSPKEEFGHNLGDDYFLANYQQLLGYWQKLEKESDRMKLVEMGKTEEGRPQMMAIVTSPDNLKKLDRYKEIARKLALAEGVSDEEARKLAQEGKAVVWIDGGLHATEVLGAQQLMETLYQMVSRTDPETMRFLRDVIILFVHANPDGHDLVADHYMREKDPLKRRVYAPRLYQKYVGHDNNRDFYLSAQKESTNMNRVMYREWFPQIMYNHHQTGPAGAVLFAPPFRDPFNYYFDPLVMLGTNRVGYAMHQRLAEEDKPGGVAWEGASYSVWFNGGLRTTAYFHNMVGILTETIGSPTPMEIPFVPRRLLSTKDQPNPITPQKWHFRQSIDYSVTNNRAVLDIASKYREEWLYNIYKMGRNSIERGSRDHWTITPRKIDAVEAQIRKDRASDQEQRRFERQFFEQTRADGKYYAEVRKPELRDPRGYILPADQDDFLTATKFMNSLIKTGVTVHRATGAFTVNGKNYPAGSYVVKTAQAFRPHILDLFEPQDHPNDFKAPGSPPTPPYDNAGWTLAYQMGVKFDRILDGFEAPLEKIADLITPAPGRMSGVASPAGYLVSHKVNDSFVAVNRLLKAGEDVYWMKSPVTVDGVNEGPGAMYIPAKASTRAVLEKAARDLGLSFTAVAAKPAGDAMKLKPVRIGLWDRFGGSMPSGWIRWLFEQMEFPFEVVYPKAIDAGNLRSKYDVLVFVGGAIPARDGDAPGELDRMPSADAIPAEYQAMTGSLSVKQSVPELKRFLEAGGTVLTIGSSTALARHLGFPIQNHLTERTANGPERPLSRDKFYVPGSILEMKVDNRHPLAWGMGDKADFLFDNSPVFRVQPEAAVRGVKPVAWFASAAPLRSGWAWGQQYLEGGAGALEVPVGEGKLFLFGPEITFRAQPHGTFKMLFNGIYYGTAQNQNP
jgi:hypothetical protein